MSDRYQSNGGPPATAFSMVQRVRFGDLDAMQHMNNVEFLRFFETARIDYLMGVVPEHHPGSRQQFGFIFAECHIAYRSPVLFDEEVTIGCAIADVRRSSFRVTFEMHVAGRLAADGYGVLVGFDYDAQRAARLPEGLKGRMEAEAEADGTATA